MSTIIKPKYVTNGTALTITLTSLGPSTTAGRESNVIDNTTDRYDWFDVYIKTKIANSDTVASPFALYVWWYPVIFDAAGNALYPGGLTGSDADATPTEGALNYLGAVPLLVKNTSYSKIFRIHGPLPPKCGVYVRNQCGVALSGTAGDHLVVVNGGNMEIV